MRAPPQPYPLLGGGRGDHVQVEQVVEGHRLVAVRARAADVDTAGEDAAGRAALVTEGQVLVPVSSRDGSAFVAVSSRDGPAASSWRRVWTGAGGWSIRPPRRRGGWFVVRRGGPCRTGRRRGRARRGWVR